MLHVHRSDRADALVGMLADLVAEPLPDALTPEVVSVPTQGIERWLTQRLAAQLGTSEGGSDGVCANVEFPFPGNLIAGALARACDTDPHADPWQPQRAVWPLMEVVQEYHDEPWIAPLAEHIANSETVPGSKRFSSIRHVADLFDRYAVHRPDMLQRWAAGEPLDSEPVWQVELWRLLRERIGRPSPAERLREACIRLRGDPELLDLPPRLSLFGLTRLAASSLEVLEALSAQRDVHLFLSHPSPALWTRMEGVVRRDSRFVNRAEDPTAELPRHPLLSSWGRDAREMQLVVATAVAHGDAEPAGTQVETQTLLQRVQDDIRFDRSPSGTGTETGSENGAVDARPLLEEGDDSVQVHACHGRGRQVEVLRDAVLHLLEADPTLEPRDVIVLCPDIESFAPLIQATFGSRDLGVTADPARQLEIRLADRSLRQTNPLMGVVAEVLEMASARITATEVLDLAGREPVRQRFGFDDRDLFRLEEWVERAFVRWGFDASHRHAFQLADVGANTWQTGLDRILLGVAMAEEEQRLFGGVLPLDDVDSGDIELAGQLAEFVHRLRSVLDALDGARPVDAWAGTLAWAADALAATAPQDAWHRAQLGTVLEELIVDATVDGVVSPVELGYDDISSIVTERLRGRPTRANFRTGHLTVCTLVPMRSIPHRVVCLLGLDDGRFPRHVEKDGDDLMARAPRVGDRDPRSEDRQILLDALLAAREHLVITYTGRDERSNLPRPPAVPVGEFLDVIDHTVRVPEGRARDRIVVAHPLQPFDPRNFEPGALVAARPWSFDALQLAGARAKVSALPEARTFLEDPLGAVESDALELEQLERFLRHPVRTFLRSRLRVSLFSRTREFHDAIPIDLDGLERWQVAERILQARLAGAHHEDCVAAEIARGALPPGRLAATVLDAIADQLDELVDAGSNPLPPTPCDVRAVLTPSMTVVGSVPALRGDAVHSVTYSRLGPAARLTAWVRLLALTASAPERPFEATTIGRSGSSVATISVAHIAPLGPDVQSRGDAARRYLAELVDLFQRGLREPMPLYCRTSAAWATAAAGGSDPVRAASAEWTANRGPSKENGDAEHLLVLGGKLSFTEMLERGGEPRDGEAAWVPTETTRFGSCARRLWDALLAHEEVVDR